MFWPSDIQRYDDLVGIAIPTMPLSCAAAGSNTPTTATAPSASFKRNCFTSKVSSCQKNSFGATAEPALPGRWWRPLEGEAATGRFGGGSILAVRELFGGHFHREDAFLRDAALGRRLAADAA